MSRQLSRNRARNSPRKTAGWLFDLKAAVIVIAFIVAAYAVTSGFYRLQVTEGESLAAKAAAQQFVTEEDRERRGMILDKNGYPLVFSTYVFRVGMTPADVHTRKDGVEDTDIIRQFGIHLGLDEEATEDILIQIRTDRATGWRGLEKQLSGHQPLSYVTIATEVPETDAMALKDWLDDNGVGGVRFDAEERRVYNNESLASQVLGLIQMKDGKIKGVSGLEATYNGLLSGEPGYTHAKRNNYATRGMTPFSRPINSPSQKSSNLVTTLDMEVNTILQEELFSVAAAAGLIADVNGLIMDVRTGDVLAMAQVAPFDLSRPDAIPLGFTESDWNRLSPEEKTAYLSSNLWNNNNIIKIYEPGSVFKAVTLAIGLEEGVASEQSLFSDDPLEIQGEAITCHTGYGHGLESLREAFYRSCNPVFVQLGDLVGKDLFYEWTERLGLYGKTGIDLPMESPGHLHADPMPIDFSNLTFGESSYLTAIRIAQLFATIGNGGYEVTPRLGYATSDEGIETMIPFELQQGSRVFSEETTERVLSMMTDVVRKGTAAGTFGAMGLSLGGKTGTAVDSSDGRRTFSFVGLAPCDQPQYVILVTVHKPETTDSLGSAAARAANRVAARLLNRQGHAQDYSAQELARLGQPVELPDLSGLSLGQAALELSRLQLAPNVPSDAFYLDNRLFRMEPQPGTLVGIGTRVWLYPGGHNEVEWVAVPDFRGRNYHECVWLAAEYGVSIVPAGLPVGLAVEQSIPATSSRVIVQGVDETGSPVSGDREQGPSEGKVRKGEIITIDFAPSITSGEDG